MNDTITWIGGACIALSVFFAIAGVGWWRFAVALLVSLVLAALAASGVGWAVWKVAFSFEHGGGEWRGLGSLAVAVIATGVVFLIVFVLMMIVLAMTKRSIFRRAKASYVVLGISGLVGVAGIAAFALNTPQHMSNEQLIRQLENSSMNTEIEDELARRGSTVVPVILAELLRLSKPGNTDGYLSKDAPPLLRMLGRLGGSEAKVELHKWAEAEAGEGIRVSAVTALADQGDRGAETLLVQFLARNDGQWPSYRPELLKALGRIKAADQIGTIRDVVALQPPFTPPHVTPEGIAALAAIGTGEAWAAIAELSRHTEKSLRAEVLQELGKFPGSRSMKLLSNALDDPEPSVREAAYWSLLRIEPSLNAAASPPWNESTNEKIREAVKNLGPRTP